LLQANFIYDCELEGAICHMAPFGTQNYYNQYIQFVPKGAIWQMVPFSTKKIMILQLVHIGFVNI